MTLGALEGVLFAAAWRVPADFFLSIILHLRIHVKNRCKLSSL